MVSSHWSGQRGEFPVLHHSDGCVQLHYAWAAGSPSCRGRSTDSLAPLAQGLWPRLTGQGLVWTQAWLLANGSSWSVVVVSWMIYRRAGWRECKEVALLTGQGFLNNPLKAQYVDVLLIPHHEHFTWTFHLSGQLLKTFFFYTFNFTNLTPLSHLLFPYICFPWNALLMK